MMPAVLRHDGKLKTQNSAANLALQQTKSTAHVSKGNNASLADLSIVSGDVSMYTIKDAQKF